MSLLARAADDFSMKIGALEGVLSSRALRQKREAANAELKEDEEEEMQVFGFFDAPGRLEQEYQCLCPRRSRRGWVQRS